MAKERFADYFDLITMQGKGGGDTVDRVILKDLRLGTYLVKFAGIGPPLVDGIKERRSGIGMQRRFILEISCDTNHALNATAGRSQSQVGALSLSNAFS